MLATSHFYRVLGHLVCGAAGVDRVVAALDSQRKTALLLGGRALREDSLATAGRIAKACGVRVLSETFTARLQRGAGRAPVERLPYFAEQVSEQLYGLEQLILVGATTNTNARV